MSRFYDDDDGSIEARLAYGRWRGRCAVVLRGKPGKAALKDLERALLLMPHKRLIEGDLCDGNGVCANGAWVYRHYVDQGVSPREAWRRLKKEGRSKDDLFRSGADLERTVKIASENLGITRTLAEIVAWVNDDKTWAPTPEVRYARVLKWVQQHL